jgi:hypothetical protein
LDVVTIRHFKITICLLLIVAMVGVAVNAGELSDKLDPIVKIIYSGATPIKDSTATKAPAEKAATIKTSISARGNDRV